MRLASKKPATVAVLSGLGLAAVATTALAQTAEAPKGWKTTAQLGATITRGNSETTTVNGGLNTERKWAKDELAFGAAVTYGEDHNSVTASSITGFGQYNRLFTDRFYGYGRVDALHDDIANIAYRVTLSPGVGYYFLKNNKFTLSGEVGPGVVFEQLFNEDERTYATIRFGEKFTWQINKNARLWQTFDYQPKVDDWAEYVMNAEVGIATKITEHLDLRVVAQDTYRSRPAKDRKENDFKLIAGVGYTF